MLAWESLQLSDHQDAWEKAKSEAGVTDVRLLTPAQFSRLVQRAEEIRNGKTF